MNQKAKDAVAELRQQGYAVAVWNADELRGADPADVEADVVEYGNEIIDWLTEVWE